VGAHGKEEKMTRHETVGKEKKVGAGDLQLGDLTVANCFPVQRGRRKRKRELRSESEYVVRKEE